MALDPRIILAGQQPDIVNVLAQSNQAAQQQINNQSQNALSGYARQNGAAIMQGDQNALAGLAGQGVDGLNAAMGIQGQRQDQAMQQQRMAMLTREEARMLEDRAMQMSAAERAAAAAQVEDAVKMGMAIQSPEQWDQVMSQRAPDLVGQFQNREALASKYMTMADILKRSEGPEYRPATPEEAARYGAAGGQINDRTGQFNPINPPSNGIEIRNADGSVTRIGGPAGGGKTPTEGQLAGAGYLQRMTGSEAIIRQAEDAGLPAIPLAKSLVVGTRAEGYVLTPAESSLAQAQRDWVRAKLRKESGAVIAEEEMAAEIQTYFPQPGEPAEIVAQKREARRRAERQMQIGSGTAAEEAGPLSASAIPGAPPEAAPIENVGPVVIGDYTVEDLN